MKKKKIIAVALAASTILNYTVFKNDINADVINSQKRVKYKTNISDEKIDIKNGTEIDVNAPLGTVKELFQADWIKSELSWKLGKKENDVVTQADLDKITEIITSPDGRLLDFSNNAIKNLHLFRNLKSLITQSAPKFDDMSFFWKEVSKLEKLETLDLRFNFSGGYGNGVNKDYNLDIQPMPSLKKLNIDWMGASEASKPYTAGPGYVFDGSRINKSNLPVIEELNLEVTPLKSYDAIATLDTLKILDLSHSKKMLSNIDFAKKLVNLEELNIGSCAVTDFRPLNSLPKLTKVRASSQQIYNIKDNSIDYYYKFQKDAVLPSKVILPDGTLVEGKYFKEIKPITGVFDDSDNTIKIPNLKKEELVQNDEIYDIEVNSSGVLIPYIANVALAKFEVPDFKLKNGTAVTIGGTFVDEINFKEGVPTYEVVFDSQGGSSVPKQSVEYGKLIKEPADPAKEGYAFEGWYKEKDYKTKWDFNKDKMPMGNITLYAKWNTKNTPGGGNGGSSGGNGGSSSGGSFNDPAAAVLASGDKYTDVLTATVLANERKSPVLLTEKNRLPKETKDELTKRGQKDIIIVGGYDSVSKDVEKELSQFNIKRIQGKDRYETAKKIGDEVRYLSKNKDDVVLVDGTNFPDVITISSLATQKRAPILLTEPSIFTKTTKDTISNWKPKNVLIGGQTNSVSSSIENEIKRLDSTTVNRIGGKDRYETASLIGAKVREIVNGGKEVILVDGTNFPDGITMNSLAAKYNCPILLTTPKVLTDITRRDIESWNIEKVIVGGGEDSVSSKVYNSIPSKEKIRIAGENRYSTAVKISQEFSQ